MAANSPQYEYQLAHLNETKQPSTIAAASILIVVTTLAVIGRLTAQRMIQPKLQVDDYCVIIALVCLLAIACWLSILTHMIGHLSRLMCNINYL
jgi:fucose permease